MKIIVQKFGGTSVATPESRECVAGHIIRRKEAGYGVVAVISAMGRHGDPYATDTLLDLVKSPKGDGALVSPHNLDLLLACGEIISSVVMAHTLETKGHSAIALSGAQAGIITDEAFGSAKVIGCNPVMVWKYLKQGFIVLVAGFQGISRGYAITTLGRGGSDTTASVMGAALRAEEVEFYKDVDGVFSADPNVCEDAIVQSRVTYEELAEMAYGGAKVIHPQAVEIAKEFTVPVRVRPTFDPRKDEEGTLVTFEQGGAERIITGIAHVADLVHVRLSFNDGGEAGPREVESRRMRAFHSLGAAGISLDFINIAGEDLFFTIRKDQVEACARSLAEIHCTRRLRGDCAKVVVVGAGMHGRPGVMSVVVECLFEAGVPILHSTDSHTTLSCLIPSEALRTAVGALHKRFCADEAEQDSIRGETNST
ncbi:MAG: aspartate kinase [Armatimonadetes bacterium]|nr:aspartate kinase [Armatimonadota bacterium]